MANTPESHVKKKVKALLMQYKCYFNMPVPAGYGEPMLDFVGCHLGRFFAIETKAEGKKLTPRQEFVKRNMEDAQGKVFVVIGLAEDSDPDTWIGWTELEMWLMSVANDVYGTR